MSDDGYVGVRELLGLSRFKGLTLVEIMRVVEEDKKGRYTLRQREGVWEIKANQGHSMELPELELEKLKEAPDVVVHGTYMKNMAMIKESGGLKVMGRNHIHLATGLPKDKEVKSGIRQSCNVFIYIDVEKAMQDGIEFFISPNGVVLTSGRNGLLEAKYFLRILNNSEDVLT